jgi:hypothetical protein
MSRFEWILSACLAILVIVLAVVGVIWWRQVARPGITTEETASEERQRYSAQSAYELAQPVAQAWSTGAQLVEANATWPPGEQFDPHGANWSFIFHGPDQNQLALITVGQAQATLFSSRPADMVYQPASREYWVIDSPALIERMLANGGQQFLGQHGVTTLRLKLVMNQTPAWQAELFARDTGQLQRFLFDAGTGQLLYTEGN